MNIIKPNDKQYDLIKNIYDDISQELELTEIFDPRNINGGYSFKRALLESISGGSHYFISEGRINKIPMPNGQQAIQDERLFEGWKYEQNIL